MNEEIYTKLVDNYFKYALVFFRPKGEVDRKMFTNQEAQLIFNDIRLNIFKLKKNTNNLHLKLLIDKLLKQMKKTDRDWAKKEQLKTIEIYEQIIKYIPFTNFCEMLSIEYDVTNDDDYIEIKINDELVYAGFDKIDEIQVQFCNVENSAFDLKEILTKNFKEIFQATKTKMEKRKEEQKIMLIREDAETEILFKEMLRDKIYLTKFKYEPKNLGCEQLLALNNKKNSYFNNALIILDGDAKNSKNNKNKQNIVFLPSQHSPERMLYEYLNSLKDDDKIWKESKFTKQYALNISKEDIEDREKSKRWFNNLLKENNKKVKEALRDCIKRDYAKEKEEITEKIVKICGKDILKKSKNKK